jgi:hypothetical protein
MWVRCDLAWLYIVILSGVLTGCNISSTSSNDDADQAGYEFGAQGDPTAIANLGTYPLFSPTRSEIPLLSDFLFAKAATTDGTAETGAFATTGSSVVTEAIDDLDGISTNAALDFKLSGSIDETTATANTVKLIALKVDATVDSLDLTALITKFGQASVIDTAYSTTLAGQYNVKVVDVDGGVDNMIRILPTKPLRARTKYIAVLTNAITTANDTPLVASTDYQLLLGNDPLYDSALIPARKGIQAWDALARGFLAAISNTGVPILTQAFTTTNPQVILKAMAEPSSFNAAFASLSKPSSTNSLKNEFLSTAIPANQVNAAFDANVKIYQGAVQLPSYFNVPTDSDPNAINDVWRANNALSSSLKTDIDGFYNVTYRFPLAVQKTTDTVPFILIHNSSCTGQLGTIIYQHGITANRLSALNMGIDLATPGKLNTTTECFATIAIDLNGHGVAPIAFNPDGKNVVNSSQQTFRLYPNAGSTTPYALEVASKPSTSLFFGIRERHKNWHYNASSNTTLSMDFDGSTLAELVGESGSYYINLSNFQRTRDNLLQSVVDLLYLNAELADIATTFTGGTLSTTNRLFIGDSLGGIVGASFVAVNNMMSCDHNVTAPCNATLPNIDKAILTNAGTQITKLLENSSSFAPILLSGLSANQLNQGTRNFESYFGVFQAVIDSVDPINFVGDLFNVGLNDASNPVTPTMLIRLNGGQPLTNVADRAGFPTIYKAGTSLVNFLSDLVVPVNATDTQYFSLSSLSVVDRPETAYSPLAGQQGLIDASLVSFASETLNSGSGAQNFTTNNRGLVTMGTGTHITLSARDASEPFDAMREAIADFLQNPAAVTATANQLQ